MRSFSSSRSLRCCLSAGSKLPLHGTNLKVTGYIHGRIRALGFSLVRRLGVLLQSLIFGLLGVKFDKDGWAVKN